MDNELKKAYRICQSLAKREAGNFYWAFRFLPRDKRWAISAVYAFCWTVDDLVDHAEASENVRGNLRQLLEEFDAAMSGSAGEPLFLALADACGKFSIPRKPFEDLIAGVEMDLDGIQYATVEDVEVYCRKVASSVGQMTIAILGAKHPNSRRYADQVGLALQWTNILRDVGEDANRGRVYIPTSMLQPFQVSRDDIIAVNQGRVAANVNPVPWNRLFSVVSRQALGSYRKANEYLPKEDLRALVVAEIMKSIYLATLRKIQRLKYPVFHRRVSLSPLSKISISLWVAFRQGILGLGPAPVRLEEN
jgi:phytoene synthase